MKRSLSLRRESVAPLTSDELAGVNAAAAAPTLPVEACLAYSVIICYTRGTTCACAPVAP